jgi:PhoPQ-activated pathogenicity-related protein
MVYRIACVTMVAVLSMAGSVAHATALDDYVAAPDPAYGYTLLNTVPGAGFTDYILEMTSQTWRSAAEIDVPLWTHHLVITVPTAPSHNEAFLYIEGGSSSSGVPTGNDPEWQQYATTTNSVCARLRQVPNQPLVFLDDPGLNPRTEDDQIAHAWEKFLFTGDAEWLSRFPMTKAAVSAMDTITAFLALPAQGSLTVDQFVVAGASKRGWTTWTTAAVDSRVIAFVPLVIDLLNLDPSFRHHYAALGFWQPAIWDYENHDIMSWFGTRPMQDLYDLVDPYSYLARYATKPKYVYNSAGDQFFLPDSSQFYFDDLPGVKHLRYLQNTGHGLDSSAYEDILPWYTAIINGTAIPTFTWAKQPDGSIIVDTTGTTPTQVLLWQATNPAARDFNIDVIGAAYTSSVLAPSGPDQYTASVPIPGSGWTAFFVEITYASGGPYPFRFTTEVSVLPDTTDYVWDQDTDNDGTMDLVDTDDDDDGVLDVSDFRPRDTDDDTLPNHVDDDDDNDTFSDVDEGIAGTNPLDPFDYPGAPPPVPAASFGVLLLLAAALATACVFVLRGRLTSSG